MKYIDTKFDFLIGAITDTQETLRFIEAKAGLATLILGGIIATLLSETTNIWQNYPLWGVGLKVVFGAMLLSLVVCVILLVRIVQPLNKVYCPDLTPRFYLKGDKVNPLCPRRKEIAVPVKDYKKHIEEASEESIIESLICELYTVSYIREVKTQRLNNLLVVMSAAVILFLASYLLIKRPVPPEVPETAAVECCSCNFGSKVERTQGNKKEPVRHKLPCPPE